MKYYYIEKMVVFYIGLLTERLQHHGQKQKFGLQGLGGGQFSETQFLGKYVLNKPTGEKNILTDASADKSYFSQHEHSG